MNDTMRTFKIPSVVFSRPGALAALVVCSTYLSAGATIPLFELGAPDKSNAEFALGPGGWSEFKSDGLFIVGESDTKRDWPYVHPGPADAWAGNRQHTFTILFALKNAAASGECRLNVHLLDTHAGGPPSLQIQINGHAFERKLPSGAGDDSLHGQPAKGRPYQFTVQFPSNILRAGDNDIEITTVTGSWMLYDSVALEAPSSIEPGTVSNRTVFTMVQPVRALVGEGANARQPIRIHLKHFGEKSDAVIRLEGAEPQRMTLEAGEQIIELSVPYENRERVRKLTLESGAKIFAEREVIFKTVPKMVIYVLPHSHTDIGYTEIQTAVEKKQVRNLVTGMAIARRTANYPEGARFVWNVEVLWAADSYLRTASPEQRAEFFDAVKKGWVGLNGMYLNELTGLCRPEELLRLFRFSTQLANQTGKPIDAAMISDVPGYTWGTVTAMAQAGIKYFSVAPNYFDRIGDIMVQWENKPFYWASPSDKEKVLVWIPYRGYGMSHIVRTLTPDFVANYIDKLDEENFTYEIAYMRWAGRGDNAVPDPEICEFIKDWNSRYTYPHFIISSTSDAFRAFEQRYGSKLPVMHGDWTPYWEDGAGSSALETGMNRASADRLTQAETLWALLRPAAYPAANFNEAWRNVLLYSEHTWGADCSVWDPENQKTKEQWEIKRSYALQGDALSRELLKKALGTSSAGTAIEVFNMTSWPRTEVAVLSGEQSQIGDCVTDESGKIISSQRLASGELAFLAENILPFGFRRYRASSGGGSSVEKPMAHENTLDNGIVRLRVDGRTGGIVELSGRGGSRNLVDTSGSETINDYLFLPGDDLANVQRNGPVRISIKQNGPLVASLEVESEAPGCRKLMREVRLTAGADYVELIDRVDKLRADIPSHPPDHRFAQKGGKESVNFAFPFNIPGGKVLIEPPLSTMRPEKDQLPGACKNWFTVNRWVDIANDDFGITWVTLDAPLVEVGGITATLLGSQTAPEVWRKKVGPTQKIYSWAMNNHWGTNYRAYQEGPVTFRYILRPHKRSTPADAARFALGFAQPLIATQSRDLPHRSQPLLNLDSNEIIAVSLKPSDDGKAMIVRLLNNADSKKTTRLTCNGTAPVQLWLSNTSEKPVEKIGNAITLAGHELETIRVEMP
jgi:hypothetical protein